MKVKKNNRERDWKLVKIRAKLEEKNIDEARVRKTEKM